MTKGTLMVYKSRWNTFIGLLVSIALSISSTGAASATSREYETTAYSNSEISEAQQALDISKADITESVSNKASLSTQGVTFSDIDAEQVTAIEVEQVDGEAVVALQKDGFISVDVSAVVDDKQVSDSFDVISLTIVDDNSGDYIAELRSSTTGELIRIDTTLAEPQAFPVLVVLGAVARVGIKAAIKQYTKTQIKKAAKSYLLKSLDANSWKHIMQAKHNWSRVGAKSRGQIAEIIGKAMANGTHKVDGKHMKVSYWYKGRKVVVTYAKYGGKISDAWVVK